MFLRKLLDSYLLGGKLFTGSCSVFRFSYIALCSLALLKHMDKVDVDKAVQYIVSCKNLDGGFGSIPGAESHAGQSMLRKLPSPLVISVMIFSAS